MADLVVRSALKMIEQTAEMRTAKMIRVITVRMALRAGVSWLGTKRARE